jgi:hypothetical protein
MTERQLLALMAAMIRAGNLGANTVESVEAAEAILTEITRRENRGEK